MLPIQTRIIISLCVLCFSAYPKTLLASEISISSSKFGYGNSWCDTTDIISAYCNGKDSCAGFGEDMFMKKCGDPSWGNIKRIEITYECGNSVQTAQTGPLIYWRISCPPKPQPNVIVSQRIQQEPTCEEMLNKKTPITLPTGYNFCWAYRWDFSKSGNSDSSYEALPGKKGINILWHVEPTGFPCPTFGRGSINHLWAITGVREGDDCPPYP